MSKDKWEIYMNIWPNCLSFQKGNIDPVESVKAFDRTSELLELFVKKGFEKLTSVRDFLFKAREDGGE